MNKIFAISEICNRKKVLITVKGGKNKKWKCNSPRNLRLEYKKIGGTVTHKKRNRYL